MAYLQLVFKLLSDLPFLLFQIDHHLCFMIFKLLNKLWKIFHVIFPLSESSLYFWKNRKSNINVKTTWKSTILHIDPQKLNFINIVKAVSDINCIVFHTLASLCILCILGIASRQVEFIMYQLWILGKVALNILKVCQSMRRQRFLVFMKMLILPKITRKQLM